MKVLTVVSRKGNTVCLDFDAWERTGEIVEVPGVTVPLFNALVEVPSLRSVIGIPGEQRFRIEARAAGYTVLRNTPD